MHPADLLTGYDLNTLTIAALGGHSGLETALGAKRQGFRTLIVARNDRKRAYEALRTDQERGTGCVDDVLTVNSFEDILTPDIQNTLRAQNTLFVHSRYFWVYFSDYSRITQDFRIPLLGTRSLLPLEERDTTPNQYHLLAEAGIRIPRIFKDPAAIDRLTLTKVNNATRTYERENFLAATPEEWQRIADEKISLGLVTAEALKNAVIEEFILGAQVNFNFFYSPLANRLELLGTDTRRQTSLDGYLRLPASEQLKLTERGYHPSHIETGHIAVTVKESLLEKAYEAGERFVAACKKYDPKGIIGPFALQGAIETDGTKEELVVFDVSFRMPGSPGITATPYSHYLFGRSVSLGERTAMEVRAAIQCGRLTDIIS